MTRPSPSPSSSPVQPGDVCLDHFVEEFVAFSETKHFERRSRVPISTLSLEQAYEVQKRLVAHQIRHGKKIGGYKVGCTSRAIRQQLGLTEPVTGRLLHPDIYSGDTRLAWDDYAGCAVEAELVFGMGRDVTRPFRNTDEARAAIEFVSAGIEIHEFRFLHGKATTQELVARNGIHAGLVVGNSKTSPGHVDLEMEGLGLFVDGELKASGISAETMGNPLHSLLWLSEVLVARGEVLKAGQLVIPGAPFQMVKVPRGSQVRSGSTTCGEVQAQFV